MTAQELLASDFATLPDIIREHAKERGSKTAVADADGSYTYAELDAMMDRVAAALQRDGVEQGQSVAIISASSTAYAAVFLGALRAGCVAAPLAPSSTPEALAAMIADCGAPIVFLDGENEIAIANQPVAAGNRIPGIANQAAFASLSWAPPQGWRAGLEGRYLSKIYVTDRNADSAPPYFVAAIHAGYLLQLQHWELNTFARIDNLFDRQYIGSSIINESNGRYFEPAPDRSLMLGFDWSFQP